MNRSIFPCVNFASLGLAACWMASPAIAAPVVQGVSGDLNHKATITITGSAFGTKPQAAPVVWDDASGSSFLSKWSGAWPNRGTAAYFTDYRAPMRGIGLPHSNVSRYIAGSHGDNLGYDAGYNVMFWKALSVPSYPFYIYASWYQRFDDAWVFGGDNNLKAFDYSYGGSPYTMSTATRSNWYVSYGAGSPSSATSGTSWMINDDGASLQNPDVNGHNYWWGSAINPMAGQWSKVEVAVKLTNVSDGYIKLWENGALRVNYAGPTDRYEGTTRSVAIGGYVRMSGQPNNWRYYVDAYVDYTLARVVLANNSNLAQATIIENQIPTSWSATSIAVSANLGRFAPGQTAYLFVVDSAGTPNAVGYPVTIGESTAIPTPPKDVIAE